MYRISTSGDVEVGTYLEIAQGRRGEEVEEASREAASRETLIILDFGSQYNQLIARRVRECRVYCELVPYDTPWKKIASLNPKGFILSGGPASVYEPGAPLPPDYIYSSRLPILGICYGMQALAYQLGGKVVRGEKQEYGHALLYLSKDSPLFSGITSPIAVWMSHGDLIAEIPPGFEVLGYTENCPNAVIGDEERKIYGLLFHPEVAHTSQGKEILRNFLYNVCGFQGGWTPGNFIAQAIEEIKSRVGNKRVICALSGGVDSAVTATLVHRAIGDRLICLFVNNGLLRREEAERTLNVFRRHLQMNVIYIDASERFLARLRGVTDPEQKRRVVGEEFIKVFEETAAQVGEVDFLAQGTLYPDVIESAAPRGAAVIKSHHNVGGLPSRMKLKLLEPLRYLFKDEVREVGLALGLPEEMVWRQPFPGPGLAIRIIGEVTPEKLEILRAADWIVMNEIKKAKLYRQLWQCFAVLTDARSVGVMGDHRTYGYVVAIRAVTSEDAMTADWARLPYDLLARISTRIINEVPQVNRVVYDITSKPPATIEWE